MNNKLITLVISATLFITTIFFALGTREDQQHANTISNSVEHKSSQKTTLGYSKPVAGKAVTAQSSDKISQQVANTHSDKNVEIVQVERNNQNEIKNLLIKLEKRITQIERDIDGIQTFQNGLTNNSSSHFNELEQPDVNRLFDENGNPTERARALVQQQDHSTLVLEQHINAQSDPVASADISARYNTIFSTREDWADTVKLIAAECGDSFCKVSFTYDSQVLGEMSKFELDATLLAATTEDYPYSQAKYSTTAEGMNQVTMYLATNDTSFTAK